MEFVNFIVAVLTACWGGLGVLYMLYIKTLGKYGF